MAQNQKEKKEADNKKQNLLNKPRKTFFVFLIFLLVVVSLFEICWLLFSFPLVCGSQCPPNWFMFG